MNTGSALFLLCYRAATALAALPGACYLAWRRRADPPYGRQFWQLLGYGYPRDRRGCVVFHAASMGEANAVRPLAERFAAAHPGIRTVITTLTTTGRNAAARAKGANVLIAPLDSRCACRRFFRALKPRLLVITDTELWPEKLCSARKARCPVIIVSARMQERNLQAYLRHPLLSRDLLASNLERVLCASPEDRERFLRLGVPEDRTEVTGSLKYDLTPDTRRFEASRALRRALKGPVLGAVSTHGGEEGLIIRVFERLRRSLPSLSLVLVPRHKSGVSAAAKFLESRHREFTLRSAAGDLSGFQGGILIGDTMGEIALYFGLCDLVFMGGSFADIGGHNPLEPACYAIASVTGPEIRNFREEYQRLAASGGAFIVKTEDALYQELLRLLTHPDACLAAGKRAQEVQQTGRGAVARSLEVIDSLLARHPHFPEAQTGAASGAS